MKILIYFLSLAVVLLTGCNRLDEMDTKLSDLDSRVIALENKLESLNKEVALISELLNNKYFIQNVVTTDNPVSYKIVLVDANGSTKEYQISNGADVRDGLQGRTPAIGIRMAEDGCYYWTLNGDWLLVEGEKVRANGVDGRDGAVLTPEFKVENGKWWVKLGDGEWEFAGEAISGVNNIIESIDTQSKPGVVIFHLTNGTRFEVQVVAEQVDVATKADLIIAAGSLYDADTDSFSAGTISIRFVDDVMNKTKDLVCRMMARYTTTDDMVWPYIQVWPQNPPFNSNHRCMRYKVGEKGIFRYSECKCITNGKTSGFDQPSYSGDYIVRITIPEGVTLYIDAFLAEYSNDIGDKDSFKVMQHGRIFNAEMDCETNWQGWSHVNNYGAIVVPKRTTDGVWVCYHDNRFTFDENHVEKYLQIVGGGTLPEDFPASIQACTYAQVQQLEYRAENSFNNHDKIPTLELFLQYCLKMGVHPVFSIHPNWKESEWREIKDLVERYALLDKLNIKGTFSESFIDLIYSVFGSEIESFVMDKNMAQPTYEEIKYLAGKDWDKSRINIGFEYMSSDGSYFSDESLAMMRENGLVQGVAPIWSVNFPADAEFIKSLIAKGCYELTADHFYSNGLNW